MAQKNINVFIDAHCFDNEFQGTRTFIKELYIQLAKQSPNFTFFIAAKNIENLKKEFSLIENCKFIQYKYSSTLLRLNIEIPAIIKKNNIDIAHFQYIIPFIKSCKYIVTTHDILFNDFKNEFSFLYRFLRNMLFKYSIKHADIKTTVSAYSQKRIAFHYKINQKQIFVIPNGVSADYFNDYNKNEAQNYILNKFSIENYILYVSRIEPRKNHITLLNSFLKNELYKKNLSLVFIGKISIQSDALNKLIQSMPLQAKKHFHHIEQVDNNDLMKLYQACKVFVYPTKAEGFGIPPIEAGALKVPVICSNNTAMSDFTFFNQTFFDPLDENKLSSLLNKILFSEVDTQLLNNISEEIAEKYSWKNSADVLKNLIEKTLK